MKKIISPINILIGTDNPCKIEGAKIAFSKYYENINIISKKVSSQVPDQPFNEEILQGAKNRINQLKLLKINDIDFYISNEGGIINLDKETFININLALIEDKNGYQSVGTSPGYMIPKDKIEEIKNISLGKFLDKCFNGKELNRDKGGIFLLTGEQISRIEEVEKSFIMALIPFLERNKKIWK